MSQVSIIDIEGNNPQIPTEFVADSGSAVPLANILEVLGDTTIAGILPVFTEASGNTVTTKVQISQAIAATNVLNIGLSAFDSASFNVDANGFVTLKGGGIAIDSVVTDVGGPIFPDASGQISILGTIGIASGSPLQSSGAVANTVSLRAQVSSAQLVSNINYAGMSSFDSSQFSVDANGLVTLVGGSLAVDSVAVQTGTSPVVPTVAGLLTINGAVVAAGTNPVRSNGTGANTLAIEVQTSQAIAGADATKIGLSNFDSASFAVAATGFVTLSTTGAIKTLTGDTGGALSPTANNINILGGPGVTITGSGSTLTVNSVVFTDTTATTMAVDNGYFATAAGTYGLPASAAQGEEIIIVCDTAGAVVVDAPTNNFIRIGNQISSSSGTATSSAIGDSLTLRYRLSSLTWYAVSSVGNWVVA